jgi:hypothetical protein
MMSCSQFARRSSGDDPIKFKIASQHRQAQRDRAGKQIGNPEQTMQRGLQKCRTAEEKPAVLEA